MMDDFVPTSERDYLRDPSDDILLVDIDDILQEVDRTLRTYGETPAYDNIYEGNIVEFLFDMYDELGYLPNGNRMVSRNIRDVLDTFTQYFDRTYMSALERQCWYVAAQKMVDRFVEFKLYNHQHIHRYNFYNYHHGTLYLVHESNA